MMVAEKELNKTKEQNEKEKKEKVTDNPSKNGPVEGNFNLNELNWPDPDPVVDSNKVR